MAPCLAPTTAASSRYSKVFKVGLSVFSMWTWGVTVGKLPAASIDLDLCCLCSHPPSTPAEVPHVLSSSPRHPSTPHLLHLQLLPLVSMQQTGRWVLYAGAL